MTDRELLELIWARMDGELSQREARTLELYLRAHPEAESFERQARDLATVLSRVADEEMPADLRASVRGILERKNRRRGADVVEFSRSQSDSRGVAASRDTRSNVHEEDLAMSMKRAIPIGIAAIVLLVLGVVVLQNKATVETDDLQGTIGTAKKFAAGQIDAEDVQLSDTTVQQMMQSDVFDRLTRDPEAQAALTNDAFRDAMRHDAFRDALANDAFRAALASDAFRDALANDAFRAALTNDAFRAALANDAFRAALANDAFRAALTNDAFRAALTNDAFRAA
ncbi:MAG: hypothetical protein OEQ13_15035, partial [Acidobacteriota bacterium]|nr:hypothetical protein [Acidobacteriota bacterium]